MKKSAAFQKALKTLNEKQSEAVQKLDGPMILLAGPGTGKTHVLAARVGSILLKTDTGAENILCLTYTDAGAHAMRSRLLEWIGPEAHKISISTFHSFCNAVIQENIGLFGHYDMQAISELERVKIIRSVIDELEADHPLRRYAINRYVNEYSLSSLFKVMKQEGWDFDYVRDGVMTYLRGLENNPKFIYKRKTKEFNKGDIKIHLIQKEQQKMDRLLALASCYDAYSKKLRKAKRYEFDDMILWVLEVFKKDENLLSTYQEQFLYFLVDEYQDTNGAQEQLLRLLSGYWDEPNLFVVGDDDQAIYEFQGAKLDNLLDLYSLYEGKVDILALRDNYRSNQPILDAAHSLIVRNEERAVNKIKSVNLTKDLKAVLKSRKSDKDPLLIHRYPNQIQENIGVYESIKELLDEGVAPSEIAVIFTQHKYGEGIRLLLQQNGIPYQSKRKINVLEEHTIIQLRKELEYFDARMRMPKRAQKMLPTLLFHPHWGLEADDVRLLIGLNKSLLENHGDQAYKEMKAYVDEYALSFSAADKVVKVLETLDKIEFALREGKLLPFIMCFLQESDWINHILKNEDSQWNFNVLNSFWSYIKEAAESDPYLDLFGLLNILVELDDNGLSIDYVKAEYSEEGVSLLTAHGSKGLEFEYVYLVNCVDEAWEKAKTPSGSYTIPAELFQFSDRVDIELKEDKQRKLESRRRLFYVAMTRAKKKLLFSYSSMNRKEKGLTVSMFLSEVQESMQLIAEDRLIGTEKINSYILQEMMGRGDSLNKVFELNWVKKRLEELQLSASALWTYLDCKRTFFFEYVLSVEPLPHIASLYGMVMHDSLHRLLDLYKKGSEEQSEEQIEAIFEKSAEAYSYLLSEHAFQDLINKGKEILPFFWQTQLVELSEKALAEQTLYARLDDRIPIKGTIDRIDRNQAGVLRIVDYKSSRKTTKIKSRSGEDYGGIYWFQMLFYRLLVSMSDLADRRDIHCQIEYLEPKEKGKEMEFANEQLDYSEEDMEWMRKLVEESYDEILEESFSDFCDDSSCKWCALKLSDKQSAGIFESAFKDSFDD